MATSKKWGFASIPVDSSISLVWKTELIIVTIFSREKISILVKLKTHEKKGFKNRN